MPPSLWALLLALAPMDWARVRVVEALGEGSGVGFGVGTGEGCGVGANTGAACARSTSEWFIQRILISTRGAAVGLPGVVVGAGVGRTVGAGVGSSVGS